MANFPTHIAVGTVVSGALATVTVAADLVAPENIVAVTLAGVLGSVLPDIDLKESRPARAMFAGLAVFFSFVVLFSLERKYSIAEMLILWLGTLVFVRYVGKEIFFRFSYHRGIWHSLLAMRVLRLPHRLDLQPAAAAATRAWPGSRRVHVVGFLTHLILDEIYSVDVMDTRIKASFGTALKLVDTKHWGHSAAMARRHRAGVPADAADQDVRREHHLARALDRAASPPAAAAEQVVPGHGVGARDPARRQGQHRPARPTSPISTGSILPGPVEAPKGNSLYRSRTSTRPASTRHGGDEAGGEHGLAQQHRAQQRCEQHAGLAQGGNECDRRHRHGPDGDAIGGRG